VITEEPVGRAPDRRTLEEEVQALRETVEQQQEAIDRLEERLAERERALENAHARIDKLLDEHDDLALRTDGLAKQLSTTREYLFGRGGIPITGEEHTLPRSHEDLRRRFGSVLDQLAETPPEELQATIEDEQKERSQQLAQLRADIRTLADETDTNLAQATDDDQDNIARLWREGPAAVTDDINITHRRGHALLNHLYVDGKLLSDGAGTRWAGKVSAVRTILSVARDEKLAYRQIERVAEKLEELARPSDRTVTFSDGPKPRPDDRGDNQTTHLVIQLRPDEYQRLTEVE
jgi:regulator of replication initiation timing